MPRGLWRLPPQQRVLQPEETNFDLHRVATELTVIVSTSVGHFTPCADTPLAALESLQANVALRWCRKLLVFDKVPSTEEIEALRGDQEAYHHAARADKWLRLWNSKRESYEEYCAAFRDMKQDGHPALFNVELLFLPRFGHLLGTVQMGLEHIQTPYAFITQHDLRLVEKFDAAAVQRILDALDAREARYVNLNRDANSSSRTTGYFRVLPPSQPQGQPPDLRLTAVAGFSDQAHFVETEWYRREVLGQIPATFRLTCMEHFLHERWKESDEWRGTFLYGGPDEGPFVLDYVHGLQAYDQEGRLQRVPPPPNRPVE